MKADGKDYDTIGLKLGIRSRTAMQYAIRAKEKLRADNVMEAVAIAVRLKLIFADGPSPDGSLLSVAIPE